MSATPPPQTEDKQRESGAKLLLLGGVLALIGFLVVVLVDGGTPEGIGVAFMSLGTVPTVAGLALLGTSLVAKRSRQGKPFA